MESEKLENPEGFTIVVGGTSRKPITVLIKYSDKRKIVKAVLVMLKQGYLSAVKWSIAQCRLAGYDYPEFRIIEKSIGSLKEGT